LREAEGAEEAEEAEEAGGEKFISNKRICKLNVD
jgi:hypothetical protein